MSDEELTPGQKIEQAMGNAIAAAVGEFNNGFVVKWVSAVEIMDEEGERMLYTFVSDNAKRWDVFGMLAELEHYQVACSVANILQEE